jgi:crotonobetainyl-CoA:carnitine CoA-transferase CaiB-like acyl-CoA transferase
MTVDFLGRLLADEGADVIKVETPSLGDYLRNIMTRFGPDNSVFHLMLNRNKRSITVDARTPEGEAIMGQLLADADVFITGNVGATNEKLGLDFESVREIKPDIVYCQATGYGASGPYSEVPTHGQMMDDLGGAAPDLIVNEQGFVVATHGESGSGGVVIGPLFAAFGVAAGLVRASRAGEGCYLDVSCADAVLAGQWLGALPALNPEKVDPTGPGGGTGGGAGGSAKYQHYETKDHRFILFCGIEPKFWDHFCRAVGREDLIADHDRDLVVDFARGEDELRRDLQRIFHTKTLAEWMHVAAEHDIAMGPAVRFAEVQDDPHLIARGMVMTEHHPLFGDFLTLGNPLVVPGETFTVRSAPAHGEHTDEILGELGYDPAARSRLRAAGVV